MCWPFSVKLIKCPLFLNLIVTHSLVGTVMGYGLDNWGSILSRGKFFLFSSVQTGSGTQPATYPVGIQGAFPEIKAAET
jgi:hypothetical protein